MSNKLVDFYKGIIESLGLTVNQKGGVYIYGLDHDEPFNVNGKHLVLPTDAILKNPDWEHQIAFHPLSENIARKDSVVFKSLQSMANISLDTDIGYIMNELITYCADTDKHGKLNAKQTAFLSLFPNADETSVANWFKIETKIGKDHHYARMMTYRDKKLNGESWSRSTFVTFPFYNEICKLIAAKNGDYTVYGVKLRKKDAEGIKALFEYILRDVANPDDEYSTGSRSLLAPSFHSFITCFYKVKKELERSYKLLKLDTGDLNWGSCINDLNQFKGIIPPLQGNEGEVTEGERRKQELNMAQSVPTVSAAPLMAQPAVQPYTPAVQPMATPTVAPAAPARTIKVGTGLNKREIPVGPAQGLAPVQPMMQQPMYAQPMTYHVNQNGQYVDAFGRPLPVPSQGRATVVGYANQPQYAQPQQPYMPAQPTGYNPYAVPAQMAPIPGQNFVHPLMR